MNTFYYNYRKCEQWLLRNFLDFQRQIFKLFWRSLFVLSLLPLILVHHCQKFKTFTMYLVHCMSIRSDCFGLASGRIRFGKSTNIQLLKNMQKIWNILMITLSHVLPSWNLVGLVTMVFFNCDFKFSVTRPKVNLQDNVTSLTNGFFDGFTLNDCFKKSFVKCDESGQHSKKQRFMLQVVFFLWPTCHLLLWLQHFCRKKTISHEQI